MVAPKPVPVFHAPLVAPGVLLHPLGQGTAPRGAGGRQGLGRPVPDLDEDAYLTPREATQMIHQVSADMLPTELLAEAAGRPAPRSVIGCFDRRHSLAGDAERCSRDRHRTRP